MSDSAPHDHDQTWVIATGRDDYGEEVRVWFGDEQVISIFTSWDSPEDNSVSRLGIAGAFEGILERTWKDGPIIKRALTEEEMEIE